LISNNKIHKKVHIVPLKKTVAQNEQATHTVYFSTAVSKAFTIIKSD